MPENEKRTFKSFEELGRERGRDAPQERVYDRQRIALPAGYLRGGYFNENGVLKDDLIKGHALDLANSFVRCRTTPGQIRKFYGAVRFAERRLGGGENFASVRPQLLALEPQAAYAVARAGANGSGDLTLLKQFIDANVAACEQDETAFKQGFVPHFENVVAWFTYCKSREGR